MSSPPANVEETTRLIIEAGIAQRMIDQPHQGPNYPRKLAGCRFWVEEHQDPHHGRHVQVIIQFPPHGHQQAFTAMPNFPFGVTGQSPLTEEQLKLVNRLAHAWKQAQQKSSGA